MGYEYRFRLSRGDVEALARHPDGVRTVDALLRAAPGFTGHEGSTYCFNDDTAARTGWPTSVSLDEGGFTLCLYDRRAGSPDLALLTHLCLELLARCGHVEVEDA